MNTPTVICVVLLSIGELAQVGSIEILRRRVKALEQASWKVER